MNQVTTKVSTQLPAQWDATSYLKFPAHRLRPATELLARVQLENPQSICDLGCGPGHIAQLMAQRWPMADIWGVDSSAQMFAAAALEQHDKLHWIQANVINWRPAQPVDLLFANSLLHLLPHQALLPELISTIKPGGQLALQMPDCMDEAWYNLISEVLHHGGVNGAPLGSARFRGEIRQRVVMTKTYYYNALRPYCNEIDIWDSEYLQVLDGPEPVFEWVNGAGLRPILASLTSDEGKLFIRAYRARLPEFYPPEADGRTLFPFRRRFIVATVN
ncbi:methyltransferase domain-containing protein [Acinetobacter sp. WZC-1]|uniref:methyltransferase domain-containing protein n=1 Tax=Acinetobacter sp. WZC-1 TaxID=3459034 RepID=UPI00403D58F0